MSRTKPFLRHSTEFKQFFSFLCCLSLCLSLHLHEHIFIDRLLKVLLAAISIAVNELIMTNSSECNCSRRIFSVDEAATKSVEDIEKIEVIHIFKLT